MLRLALALSSLLALSACCGDRCAPHAVYIAVTADGAAVRDVEIVGADFLCDEQESATMCTPNGPIEDGDFDLVVTAPGFDPTPVSLRVRTNQPPAFSCDCRVPTGSAAVELGDGAPPPDAGGPEPDAGDPDLDAGTTDGG